MRRYDNMTADKLEKKCEVLRKKIEELNGEIAEIEKLNDDIDPSLEGYPRLEAEMTVIFKSIGQRLERQRLAEKLEKFETQIRVDEWISRRLGGKTGTHWQLLVMMAEHLGYDSRNDGDVLGVERAVANRLKKAA